MRNKLKLFNLVLIVVFIVSFTASCTSPKTATETTTAETTIAQTTVTETMPPETTVAETTQEALLWNEAINHIGERATVYGPVISTHYASTSKGQPTFLNIGKPYPDPDRFTVVIWGENRSNFPQAPEILYANKTLYITGLIIEYKGVAEIEVVSPSQIEE